jgi:hypothetical protein
MFLSLYIVNNFYMLFYQYIYVSHVNVAVRFAVELAANN